MTSSGEGFQIIVDNEREVPKILDIIQKGGGKYTSVIPRKENLEELFFSDMEKS
jgi:hypothetical protein